MTATTAHGVRFFVYIVESPSSEEIYEGTAEASLLERAIALTRTPVESRVAISLSIFKMALQQGLVDAMKAHGERIPILHVSAHGNADGIGFSNGDSISWRDFRNLLVPINESLKGRLLLCMSSCQGFAACRMAMQTDGQSHPFAFIVGNDGEPNWAETGVGYAAFYHLVVSGRNLVDAVQGMTAASGNSGWLVNAAVHLERGYLEYLANVDANEAQDQLEDSFETPEDPAHAVRHAAVRPQFRQLPDAGHSGK